MASPLTPALFDRLRFGLDPDWIEMALEATGTASVRKRRLPAELAIWLVLGMALFRNWAIEEVVKHLDLALPDAEGKHAAKSTAMQARRRLGPSPLKWLFERTAQVWGHDSARTHRWRGLSLYAMDGTNARVTDTPENRAVFAKHRARFGESSYPLVRLVTLMAVRSHLLVAQRFGSYGLSERELARPLWAEVPEQSLLLIDRGFFAADALIPFHRDAEHRHWLTRGRAALKWKVLKQLGPKDFLVEMTVSKDARRRCENLPKTWQVRLLHYQRPGYQPEFLLTSLLDSKQYPSWEIVELYHERWEIELSNDELKTELLEREEALRSQTPAGVEQELWGLGLAYNLVRGEMERAARLAGVESRQLSFAHSLTYIRNAFIILADAAPGVIPKRLKRLREELAQLVLPPRRPERTYERKTKLTKSPFPPLKSERRVAALN